MHQPRPYGRFSKKEITAEDAAYIEQIARSITNMKGVSQIENLKRAFRLPSGGQAIAVDMGGTFRIIVLGEDDTEDYTLHEGIASSTIPMFFSGVITRALVKEGEKVKIRLTEQCRRRLSGYSQNEALYPQKEIELARFTIKYAELFRYFEPEKPGILQHTQYAKLRPTWYSGAMAQVMQIIGGYGMQDFTDLPEDKLERARLTLPYEVHKEIEEELGNLRLPGYSGLPPESGQFKYDYKHTKTNAVAFDAKKNPWLLEVSGEGVFAMPLPVIPATTLPAFRSWAEAVNDQEIIVALDRFGGLPSGEEFPIGNAKEAWRRAGVVIKVCDTADYYQYQPMYAACGWSFNSSGSEAYNTCWHELESGLRVAYGYKMRLEMGEAENQGRLPRSWDLDNPDDSRLLDEYLAGIYRAAHGYTAEGLAVKYKLRRHTGAELLAAAKAGHDYEYWNSLEMSPVAAHTGSVTRVASGNMYWPKIISANGIVPSHGAPKFPELTGAGCETFDMVNLNYDGAPVRCDTIVFGCYVKDQLRVIKYFRDDRPFTSEEESDFEDVMVVGKWEKTVTTGSSGLAGLIHTTDDDDRRTIAPVVTHTELVGKDLGYGEPAYSSAPLLMMNGGVSRARYYEHKTTTEITTGAGLNTAALVPVFARDCILYAKQEGADTWSKEMRTSMHGMADATSYGTWTYDSIFHWIGRAGDGSPQPKDGTPVYADEVNYNPNAHSFVQSGDWLGVGGGWLDITGKIGFATDRNNTTHHGGGVTVGGKAPGWKAKSSSEYEAGKSTGKVTITIAVAGHKTVHEEIPNNWYWSFSPEVSGGTLFYFQRDAAWIAIGEAEYATTSEKKALDRTAAWGKSKLVEQNSTLHFIGVINE